MVQNIYRPPMEQAINLKMINIQHFKTMLLKNYMVFIFLLLSIVSANSQEKSLDYFLAKAEENAVALKENINLLKIGELQNSLITAQNEGFKVDVSSEVLFAPFFNSNGKAIDITTNPSANAYGYDVGITNGGLYSAQINVTKSLFNKAATDNLLFENKLKNNAISLSSQDILHILKKNVIDAYILAYQYQLQEKFTKVLKTDLEKRLEVIELLVKRGILMESDYLLMKLDIDSKNSELQQIQSNLNNANTQLYNLCGITVEPYQNLEIPLIQTTEKQDTFFFEKTFENDSLQIIASKKVFENQYKPKITLYGNSGLNAVEASNIPHNFGLSAGARLIIPIYDGHQKKYNALQSELKQENLDFYKENEKIRRKNNLKNLENQMASLKETMKLNDAQIKQQEHILEIYKGKMVQGQASVIDYLNLLQNYKLTSYTKLQIQTNLWLLYNNYNYLNW